MNRVVTLGNNVWFDMLKVSLPLKSTDTAWKPGRRLTECCMVCAYFLSLLSPVLKVVVFKLFGNIDVLDHQGQKSNII